MVKRIAVLAAGVMAAAVLLVAETTSGARVDYDLAGRPVLTYSGDVYGLVFRLDRRLPRWPNGRVRAMALIDGQTAERVSTVAGRPHCYVAVLHGYSPRYARVHHVAIHIPDAEALRKRVRLQHATAGYGAFIGNAAGDPLARGLHCAPRFRVHVPMLTRTDVFSAYETARARGFNVAIPRPFSVPPLCGTLVTEQWPKAGTRVHFGSTVRLERIGCGALGSPSDTPDRPEVPNLIGLRMTQAERAVQEVGLYFEARLGPLISGRKRHLYDNYRVTSQHPAAGTRWHRGSTSGGGFRPTPVVVRGRQD